MKHYTGLLRSQGLLADQERTDRVVVDHEKQEHQIGNQVLLGSCCSGPRRRMISWLAALLVTSSPRVKFVAPDAHPGFLEGKGQLLHLNTLDEKQRSLRVRIEDGEESRLRKAEILLQAILGCPRGLQISG